MRTLVTGATGGIGDPLSVRLAARGDNLVLAARDQNKLDALHARLPNPERHLALSVDMSNDASVDRFAAQLEEADVVLDGAVMMPPQLPRDATVFPDASRWREYFQGSFIGPLRLLQTSIDRMRPDVANGRRAKVVIVSAISSVQVMGSYAASNVLRPAWLGQAKTMAFALGSRGIHVNTVSLGGVLTEHYSELIEKRAVAAGKSLARQMEEETGNVPLGKYGRPEEVVAVIGGLLSEFSDHITGANIICDGGFTRAY